MPTKQAAQPLPAPLTLESDAQNFVGSYRLSPVRWYTPFKRVADFCAALFLAILAAPVVLGAAVIVKLTSRGPAFYWQTRLGCYGKPYTIFKLRTMVHECEKVSGPCWSTAGDPRVTRFGQFLRRSHIDELPQLWNVLRGEMSLVGPRPERPEFFPELENKLPMYRSRLLVRPGVTGLAQVQLPADTNLASVRRKLAFDLYYVRRAGPWFDAKIVLATGLHVLGVRYDLVRTLVSLPRDLEVEKQYRQLSVENGKLTSRDISLQETTDEAAKVEMATA